MILIEQVPHLRFSVVEIIYGFDTHVDYKLNKFQFICGTIKRNLMNETNRETQLKFFKVMAVPTVLCGAEKWVI